MAQMKFSSIPACPSSFMKRYVPSDQFVRMRCSVDQREAGRADADTAPSGEERRDEGHPRGVWAGPHRRVYRRGR